MMCGFQEQRFSTSFFFGTALQSMGDRRLEYHEPACQPGQATLADGAFRGRVRRLSKPCHLDDHGPLGSPKIPIHGCACYRQRNDAQAEPEKTGRDQQFFAQFGSAQLFSESTRCTAESGTTCDAQAVLGRIVMPSWRRLRRFSRCWNRLAIRN